MIAHRLEDRSDAWREHGVAQVAKLVDAAAHRQPDSIEEDLVLHVGAGLGAILRLRSDGEIELVPPQVSSDAHDVPAAEGARVADLDVVGVGRDVELQRVRRRRTEQQQIRRLHIQEVREGAHAQPGLAVVDPSVSHVRARPDVERPDAGVDGALAARRRHLRR